MIQYTCSCAPHAHVWTSRHCLREPAPNMRHQSLVVFFSSLTFFSSSSEKGHWGSTQHFSFRHGCYWCLLLSCLSRSLACIVYAHGSKLAASQYVKLLLLLSAASDRKWTTKRDHQASFFLLRFWQALIVNMQCQELIFFLNKLNFAPNYCADC